MPWIPVGPRGATQIDTGPRWLGIDAMTITGWDGREWDILSVGSSTVLVNSGVRGLDFPPGTRSTSKSPAAHGSRFRGWRAEERECFLPLLVHSLIDSDDFRLTDSAFTRSVLDPERTVTWTVTAGRRRQLTMMHDPDGAHTYAADPARVGFALYGRKFQAEPFWRGDPVSIEWSGTLPESFLPGPPFRIASSYTLQSAKLTNAGDVATPVVWVVKAPFTSASVGIGDRTVSIPFPMTTGHLTIDTDPTRMTAIDHTGADRTAELGPSKWALIPPGKDMPVSVSLAGTGSVSASLSPLYYRAW